MYNHFFYYFKFKFKNRAWWKFLPVSQPTKLRLYAAEYDPEHKCFWVKKQLLLSIFLIVISLLAHSLGKKKSKNKQKIQAF